MIFTILIPAITMRSWAEENKLGTIEILMTLPFKEFHVVLGKYLSAVTLLLIMMGLTLPIPLSVGPLGNFEVGQIVGEYLGMFFLGAAAIAIGMFLSAITKNQITLARLTQH